MNLYMYIVKNCCQLMFPIYHYLLYYCTTVLLYYCTTVLLYYCIMLIFSQSPFEVIRTVFMPMDGGREMSFTDKSDLFFKDYSLGPLFVQENYPNVKLAGKWYVTTIDRFHL